MATKKITAPAEESTIVSTDAPKLPEQLLTYGDAVKLVAGVLRANPDENLVVEAIRDIVSGTGLNVTYVRQEQEAQEEG